MYYNGQLTTDMFEKGTIKSKSKIKSKNYMTGRDACPTFLEEQVEIRSYFSFRIVLIMLSVEILP